MLHGIGGHTIAEAKQNLTFAEFIAWAVYIRKRGGLNTNLHIERGFALIAMQINRVLGGKMEMEDFMPHFDQKTADINDVFTILKRAKK